MKADLYNHYLAIQKFNELTQT